MAVSETGIAVAVNPLLADVDHPLVVLGSAMNSAGVQQVMPLICVCMRL